ncbi:MAG: helix-turn-helix domain-containing protein [Bacteroides sp.]|nr:helix-turn-helix domain-containing protein [Bacteroides sp.]
MLAEGKSKSAIARKFKVHRCTLINWLKRRDQENPMEA